MGAPLVPQLLALVAILAPAAAFLATPRAGVHAGMLAAAGSLLVLARMVSPAPLPELFLVAFVGFLLFFGGQRLAQPSTP